MTSYTDSYGREWEVIDFHVEPRGIGKRRVALGSLDAHGRAFRHRDELRVCWFGLGERDTEHTTLMMQFRAARAVAMTPLWQLVDRTSPDEE